MPKAPRRSPSTQDMVGGDNKRSPVIFQVPDIYIIVGDRTASYIDMDTTTSGIVGTFV